MTGIQGLRGYTIQTPLMKIIIKIHQNYKGTIIKMTGIQGLRDYTIQTPLIENHNQNPSKL